MAYVKYSFVKGWQADSFDNEWEEHITHEYGECYEGVLHELQLQ